jgi:hypothetical protein
MGPASVKRNIAVLLLASVFAGGICGFAHAAAPPSLLHFVCRTDYRDCALCIRAVPKDSANASKPPTVYPSLYAKPLRQLLKKLPKGSIIGEEISPAAEATIYQARHQHDSREMRDFKNFCKAHGLVFTELPIA